METANFRIFLQNEFTRRRRKNSRFSLRAFARTLGISHASLSHLLANRRPFTPDLIRRLSLALEIGPNQIRDFLEASTTRQPLASQFPPLAPEVFEQISDWRHDALLELTKTKGFRPEPSWIAKRLGISTVEVALLSERLQRLGMLKIQTDGKWVDTSADADTYIGGDFTTSAMRKYQKAVLEKSAESLENDPKSLREHLSLMVAIDPGDLPKVKALAQKFRAELDAFLTDKTKCPTAVYQMAFSFFPLIQSSEKNQESL